MPVILKTPFVDTNSEVPERVGLYLFADMLPSVYEVSILIVTLALFMPETMFPCASIRAKYTESISAPLY